MKNKRFVVAASSLFLLLVLAVTAIAFVQFSNNHGSQKTNDGHPQGSSSPHVSSKAIEELCSSTDYKSACRSSLANAVEKTNHSNPELKDLVKATVSVVVDELHDVLTKSNQINVSDPLVKGAIEDCKELFRHSKDELMSALDLMERHGLETTAKNADDLKNWLSAVLSYQQTCVDGFPEGKFKTKMEDVVKSFRQLSSNALAIITEVASVVAALDLNYDRRRLSSEEDGVQRRFGRRYPLWISSMADRTMLVDKIADNLKPEVTVAKDGSGNFTTIADAISAIPEKHTGRFVIYVKKGIYDESVLVKAANVTIYGDGPIETIVTGSKNFADGVRTYQTATFAAVGEGFMAVGMWFRNTAGASKHQAVALRVQSDRAIFLNCRMEGYESTLYAQTHRQFYRSCVISGTIDFIFGDSAAIFQNCLIRTPHNQQSIVTAQGRIDRRETTGFVFQNCKFVTGEDLGSDNDKRSFLGRPWKEYSRTVVMESEIGGFFHPGGYLQSNGNFGLKTSYFGEYSNKGSGAKLDKRVGWPGFKVMSKEEAKEFTVSRFIQGDIWIKRLGSPVHLGLYH